MARAIGEEMHLTTTNRPPAFIVKDQKPLVIAADGTVGNACRLMRERGTGSVLVVDNMKRLSGVFTGRDAVRLLATRWARPFLVCPLRRSAIPGSSGKQADRGHSQTNPRMASSASYNHLGGMGHHLGHCVDRPILAAYHPLIML